LLEKLQKNFDDGHSPDHDAIQVETPTTETAETNVDESHGHDDNAIEVEAPAAEIPESNVDEGTSNTDNGINNSFQPDIFDPRTWDALDPQKIDILLQKGPKRDLSIEHGPRDRFSRRFSALSYNRVLSNGEKCDREWLVYSKELDKVFCFCCKLIKKGLVRGQLANEGFNDWAHLSHRLKEHEITREHVTNMTSWYDLRLRLEKNQTIDSVTQ
jgi:hypothetical protein